jgi:hypothetical protein
MIKKYIGFLLILLSNLSHAQDNFSLNFFDEGIFGEQIWKEETVLKDDTIIDIVKTYNKNMEFLNEKTYFKKKVDANSKQALVNLVKREIKKHNIVLFDSNNKDFISWFEKEKKECEGYYIIVLDGKKYYGLQKRFFNENNESDVTLPDLKIALTQWTDPAVYQLYQKQEKRKKEETTKLKSNSKQQTKKPNLLENPKNFKNIFISQLSKFENNEEIEIVVIIDNKGNRTIKTISGKETKTKTDIISNFEAFKNNLNELVLKEKVKLQTPFSVRGLPDVGKTDGYIEIKMVENVNDYPDEKVEFVFSWMINSINKENKKTDYRTVISDSSIKFLESILFN